MSIYLSYGWASVHTHFLHHRIDTSKLIEQGFTTSKFLRYRLHLNLQMRSPPLVPRGSNFLRPQEYPNHIV